MKYNYYYLYSTNTSILMGKSNITTYTYYFLLNILPFYNFSSLLIYRVLGNSPVPPSRVGGMGAK